MAQHFLRLSFFLIFILLLNLSVLAHAGVDDIDIGMMEGGMMNMGSGCGMMGGSWGGGWWGFVTLIFVSFVFSVVFWWTYRWIAGDKKSKR